MHDQFHGMHVFLTLVLDFYLWDYLKQLVYAVDTDRHFIHFF